MLDPTKHGTILEDRILWYDGSSTYKAADVENLISTTDIKFVDELTDDIQSFNMFASAADMMTIKSELDIPDKEWNLPDPWNTLDVENYVFDKLDDSISIDDCEYEQRALRCATELSGLKQRGLYDALRAIIYVINMLEQRNCVWGVGRGSCVASYVLYLIGVHDIDSFAYDLDIQDFLHD